MGTRTLKTDLLRFDLQVRIDEQGKQVSIKMADSQPTLEPCPFCGATKPTLQHAHTPSFWVECDACTAQKHGQYFEPENATDVAEVISCYVAAAKSAIDAWNTRAFDSLGRDL